MKRSDLALLKVEIESNLVDLEHIIAEIEATRDDIGSSAPTHRDKAALGSFLHSLYNGIENALKRLAEEIDRSVPMGEEWHRVLLRRMGRSVKDIRPSVLRSQTIEALEPYLGFRHFFRHSYTFEIDWKKLRPLVENAGTTLRKFRTDLDNFFEKFSKRQEEEGPLKAGLQN